MDHRGSLRFRPCRTATVVRALVAVLSCSCVLGCRGGGLFGSGGRRVPERVEFTREDWSFGRAKGTKLTSEHYVLYTTCTSKPFVDAMPGFLEACWAAYAALLPSEAGPERRLETYLFKRRWYWERFTERFAPARARVYKHITSGGYSERGITVSHYSGRRGTLSVLAHEGLHQYLEVTHGKKIPAWLNEGLACYFEAFDLDPRTHRPIFKPETNSLRKRSLREALVHGGLIPLREILGTHAGIEVQKQPRHVRSYYAVEWSLVLFMMRPTEDNVYRDGFLELLRELGTESMARRARAFLAADTDGKMSYGEAVFRAHVTDDLDAFERAYEAYLHKLLKLES
jgi:hypothetical protein